LKVRTVSIFLFASYYSSRFIYFGTVFSILTEIANLVAMQVTRSKVHFSREYFLSGKNNVTSWPKIILIISSVTLLSILKVLFYIFAISPSSKLFILT